MARADTGIHGIMLKKTYSLYRGKHNSDKTESELSEIKAKYADGVPQEVVEQFADKLAEAFVAETYRRGK